MGMVVSRPPPSPRHRGPTVDESIRRRDPRVQDEARALLRMDPADRQPLTTDARSGRRLVRVITRAQTDSRELRSSAYQFDRFRIRGPSRGQ